MHDNDAASVEGPNGITLAEGQRLYQRYGSSALHCLSKARPPATDEPRDPDWQPQPRPQDEDDTQYFLPDLGQLLMALTEDALDEARISRSEVEIGRFRGLREALTLFVSQADAFGIARFDVGIDPQLDLKWDLQLDPPPGRFAG